jgi:hypothetical protein
MLLADQVFKRFDAKAARTLSLADSPSRVADAMKMEMYLGTLSGDDNNCFDGVEWFQTTKAALQSAKALLKKQGFSPVIKNGEVTLTWQIDKNTTAAYVPIPMTPGSISPWGLLDMSRKMNTTYIGESDVLHYAITLIMTRAYGKDREASLSIDFLSTDPATGLDPEGNAQGVSFASMIPYVIRKLNDLGFKTRQISDWDISIEW